MFALRLILVLLIISAIVCFGLYFFTKETRYIRYTLRIFQYGVFLALLLGLVFFVERFLLTSMGAIL